jgi:hypothetical protein
MELRHRGAQTLSGADGPSDGSSVRAVPTLFHPSRLSMVGHIFIGFEITLAFDTSDKCALTNLAARSRWECRSLFGLFIYP